MKLISYIDTFLFSFAIFCCFSFVLLISVTESSSIECKSLLRCTDCIRTAGCAWCKNPKFSEPDHIHREYTRCNTMDEHVKMRICGTELLENPKNQLQIGESDYDESLEHGEPKIRITPSSASVKLRVGEVMNITMEYYDTENKPLDLYYLMDLSATMADDKPTVATLGKVLAHRIRNLTSNVKIGFGSFIDKPIQPLNAFIQFNKDETNSSTPPYGFRNHLSLTRDIYRFQDEVQKSKTAGNLDAPEGVLDAVLQSVVCREMIGWRSNARHLLIVSTDAPFHIAGDAKMLGGIYKPNDMKCHLTKDGTLDAEAATMDYVSIAQVNAKVKEGNVFVIFAVTDEHVSLYTKLAGRIEGSATRALKDDSENVVELVEQEYRKIISSVEMPRLPPQFSKYMRLTYFAKCDNHLPYIKSSKCQDMKLGANATFQLEVELLRCPKNNKEWKQVLSISPVGVAERLVLNLEYTCDCPCESAVDPNYKENDSICDGKGTPRCGICDCAKGYIGKNCQCSQGKGEDLVDVDETACQMDNSSAVCSNRGTCLCGQCQCNQNQQGIQAYSGTYCECDDTNCPVGDNGLVCSGKGICKCSKCVCAAGFVGDSCMCSMEEDRCREPGEESTCSSRGYCKCGKCICESPFTGRLCQNCPNCPGKCEDPSLLGCIRCYVQKLQSEHVRPCQECNYLSEIKDMPEVFEESDEDRSCSYRDESGCETKYVYRYAAHDRNKIEVRVERKRRCTSDIPILWVVLGIVGSVLIGGLVLLTIWKIVTYHHDLKEWKKFKNEIRQAKWSTGVNPLYKGATSNFTNPTYRRSTKSSLEAHT